MRRTACLVLLLAGCAASQPVAPVPPIAVAGLPAAAAVNAVAAMAAIPAPVAVVPTVMDERRVLLRVAFRPNSAVIDRSATPLLDNLAAALRDERLRGARVEVNGHTDARGRFGWNVALSYLRASAIVEALDARGVSSGVLRAQGFGPLQLRYPDEPFRAENRRVEVVVSGS